MSIVTSESFFDEKPPRRAIGIETEYWLQPPEGRTTASLPNIINPQTVKERLGLQAGYVLYCDDAEDAVQQWYDLFLSDGSHLYPDMDHIEHACPTVLGPYNAMLSGLISKNQMRRLTNQTTHTVLWNGLFARTGYYRHDDDSQQGNYRGCAHHLNFCVPPEVIEQSRAQTVVESHLVTRGIWAGAGMISPDGYVFSQKQPDIGASTDKGKETGTARKPLAKIKSTEGILARYEDRTADSVISPWAEFMTIATTSLVHRLNEYNDQSVLPYRVLNPVTAAEIINRDLTMRATVETISGKRMTALEIQGQYAAAALALSKRIHLPHDEQLAATLWYNLTHHDLPRYASGQDSYRALAEQLEWPARLQRLEQKLGKAAILDTSNSRALMHDLLWDHNGPSGVGMRYWSSPMRSEFTRTAFQRAKPANIVRTPQDISRGELISRFPGIVSKIDWHEIVFDPRDGIGSFYSPSAYEPLARGARPLAL